MLRKNKIFFIFVLSILLIKGCGIFDTRDPEDPDTIRSTYVPPTTPELVIDNLTYSILEKNANNYSKCISTTQFSYIPDSKSQLIYGQIFLGWNNLSEKKYLDNLIGATENTSSSVLFLDNKNFTLINSDSASFNAQYIVVFQHRQANIPKSAKGNMTFYLSTDENNLFSITRGEEYKQNGPEFTWSQLKANFSY